MMKGIIDTTLREGEQSAGVYFDLAEKLRIIGLLNKVGIDEIEVGVAVMNPEIDRLIKQAREQIVGPKLSLWCRCILGDIEESLSLSPDVLSISISVSDIHIKNKLGKDRKWVLAKICESVKQAKDKASCYLSLGLEDASRAEFDFVEEVCLVGEREGIDRIRFADTLGIMDPIAMFDTITRLKSLLSVDIGVHTHNDFGMATANAISALAAGADFVDVTVNGLGERAGNAALEEVVAFLAKRKRIDGYNLKYLRLLSDYVAKISLIPVSPKKPVVGKDIFTCESGIHIDGLLKNSLNYEPYDPAEVSLQRKFLIGKKAGTNALRYKLESLGINAEGHLLQGLLMKVKNESSRLKTSLTNEELLHLYSIQSEAVPLFP
ncbi:MAG: homoaconitate hydratase [Proteobacteria bacterium]|nr:homoaconitate hydratase [Pseudomonadota bacterium]